MNAVEMSSKRTRRWSRARRLRMFRRMVASPNGRPRHLVVKVARTSKERTAAFRLLHDEYVRAGLSDVDVSGVRITPYHLRPTTLVFIAVDQGEVVGTLSLFERSSSGIPADRLFDLSSLGDESDAIEEVSSLAVARAARGEGEILFELFRFAFAHSMRRSVDHWVATFHPRHRHLYEAILGFEPLEERAVRSYDFVNGAPAMGACLNLRRAQERLAVLYGTDVPRTPYTWFFGETEDVFESGSGILSEPVTA